MKNARSTEVSLGNLTKIWKDISQNISNKNSTINYFTKKQRLSNVYQKGIKSEEVEFLCKYIVTEFELHALNMTRNKNLKFITESYSRWLRAKEQNNKDGYVSEIVWRCFAFWNFLDVFKTMDKVKIFPRSMIMFISSNFRTHQTFSRCVTCGVQTKLKDRFSYINCLK